MWWIQEKLCQWNQLKFLSLGWKQPQTWSLLFCLSSHHWWPHSCVLCGLSICRPPACDFTVFELYLTVIYLTCFKLRHTLKKVPLIVWKNNCVNYVYFSVHIIDIPKPRSKILSPDCLYSPVEQREDGWAGGGPFQFKGVRAKGGARGKGIFGWAKLG